MKAKEQTGEAPNYNKDSIKVLDLSNCTGLTSIGSYAFAGSGLTWIDLSNTQVTTILHDTFVDCHNLAKVKLPKDLETIKQGATGDDAFQHCESLKHIYFYNVPKIEDGAFASVTANNLTIYCPSSCDIDELKIQLKIGGLAEGTYTLDPLTYLLGF